MLRTKATANTGNATGRKREMIIIKGSIKSIHSKEKNTTDNLIKIYTAIINTAIPNNPKGPKNKTPGKNR
ncbi:MAG: hypothetical protein FXF47_05950 [Candidatus Mcinerneyibacterium aminivorans]|uniref:Uncharacterized protein n=1 Tax=Candidatus Mcinerneyibacterium aminivorans TaxID=2703815 RepID=A0A5D0MBK6_9BACT|nr:MAG: hypothetical protein FXF47_05950 [Candidatus Mcinerneyibacterium aminivorans]